MYEVYRDRDTARVGLLNSILQESGIPTILRNWTGSNITEIPIPDMFPNICVMNEEDIEPARELIRDYLFATPVDGPEWTCPKCGEPNEGTFSECWSCQSEKPGLRQGTES